MTNEHAKLLADDREASLNLYVAIRRYFAATDENKAEAWSNLTQAAEAAVKAHAALEAHPQIWDRAYWAN